ncbi:hypothetical protein CCUS01_12032 [Colletotrichum cuscutae]|uniref:Uncharacterized protein n=1 Tax=Colletotrichum cuscutae TaxID=1209917 RepID=A0AAI9U098_9PEZI|nr:hypothetical protein CCUS01_12032 [Colletotrichum cuscutae]
MVVPIIGPGSGRPIPQDAATELPLSIFFPDCYIPPFGMQAHEDVSPATAPRPADRPYKAKNLGVFVFSLVAESYVGILSHFFSFAARPSDRANFDSARSASYSQKHSLSRCGVLTSAR